MITRRKSLAYLPALILPWRSGVLLGAEFWNSKPPSQWSEQEKLRILNRSPWSREATAEFNLRGLGAGGPDGLGGAGQGSRPNSSGPGGMPGPGPGGPGGALDGPPSSSAGMPRYTALVRWESAKPVREARASEISAAPDHYIIAVSGFPLAAENPRPGRENGAPAVERLKQSTELQRKGRDPIFPDRVEANKTGNATVLVFFFPHTSQPIQASEKEVWFITKLGPLELKAKFLIKEMVYRGQLDL